MQSLKRHRYNRNNYPKIEMINTYTMSENNKKHWETVYKIKQSDEVSWAQAVPQSSLDFIHAFNVPKTARIIDVGGGDSKLVDFLIEEGYENITVLDISEVALTRAKQRLGNKSKKINWVVSDVTEYRPDRKFDVWHDRATFHFLTTKEKISSYINIAKHAVSGSLAMATF